MVILPYWYSVDILRVTTISIGESDDQEPSGNKKIKTNSKEGLLSIDELENDLEVVDKGDEEESNLLKVWASPVKEKIEERYLTKEKQRAF